MVFWERPTPSGALSGPGVRLETSEKGRASSSWRMAERTRSTRFPPAMMRILEVVGLTKRFAGLTALDAVSFTVEEGQILGLFGPNGAGKTTCFHCLSGFAAPDGGRVIFDGREITGHAPHQIARAGIGRTFQIVKPFRNLTAAENVMVALGHRRYRSPAAFLE